MVKKTWTCTTSEARPGVMSARKAMNSRPNCPAPISRPYAASMRQLTAGRATKSAAGANARANLSVASNKGGSAPRANLMTTKLVPHTDTTASASSR